MADTSRSYAHCTLLEKEDPKRMAFIDEAMPKWKEELAKRTGKPEGSFTIKVHDVFTYQWQLNVVVKFVTGITVVNESRKAYDSDQNVFRLKPDFESCLKSIVDYVSQKKEAICTERHVHF